MGTKHTHTHSLRLHLAIHNGTVCIGRVAEAPAEARGVLIIHDLIFLLALLLLGLDAGQRHDGDYND